MQTNIDAVAATDGCEPPGREPEAGLWEPPATPPPILRFSWASVVLVIAFWSAWGLLMGAGLYFSPTREALVEPLDLISISMLEGYLWAVLTFPLLALAGRVDLGADGWGLRAAALVSCGLAAAVLVAWMVPVVGQMFLFEFADGAFADAGGRSSAHMYFINHGLLASLLILATGAARGYLLRYKIRQEEAARLRAQLAESRLQSLRMQLNPHFLFNTMNTIAALVSEDPKGVRTMIARLSGLLRDTLDGAAEIPVSRELEMVERYLGIVAVRFEGRLVSHLALEPRAASGLVPNFILQPLVENAVKYAVEPRKNRTLIRVEARRSGDQLVLSVMDNGPGIGNTRRLRSSTAKPRQQGGLGLAHTRQRLSAMYGSSARLDIAEREWGGTTIEIRLPFRAASAPPSDPPADRGPAPDLAAVRHG